MNKLLTLIFTMIVTSVTFAQLTQLKYKLPDATLTASQICGKKICDPGSVGNLLHYTKTPFSPAVNKATSVEEVAIQVLGQTLPADKMLTSQDFSTCSELSKNPFITADIENIKFPDGRSIDYKRTEKLEMNIKAATEVNVKELMKQTTDVAKIEKLRAKIQAAYKKINGKELTVIGKYSEWQLSKDAREKLKKGDGYQECRKWIENNNQRILLAVGMYILKSHLNRTALIN